jgi:hypothetical protein
MSAKTVRVLAGSLFLAVGVSIGVWYLGVWSVRRTFEETHFDGLSNILQAAVGRSLANGNARYEISQVQSNIGLVEFYRRHPDGINKDKSYFRTWYAALAIADAAFEGHKTVQWQSTELLNWVAPAQRQDFWGHSFCVKADDDVSAIISAGSEALTSLKCSEVFIPEQELRSLPQGKLDAHPSGALILVLTRKQRSSK